MIRKNKMFSRPKKAFQKARIEEENELLKTFGLKNKREVWKTIAKVNYYRTRAKTLARAPSTEKENFLGKLRALGLGTNSITDVLALQVQDLLKRRLPSVVASKKLSHTVQQARQMVVHKKIKINGNVVNIPGYLVSVAEEDKITSSQKLVVPKPVEKKVESTEESTESEIVEESK